MGRKRDITNDFFLPDAPKEMFGDLKMAFSICLDEVTLLGNLHLL
jgi:hypothetical protein